ncbi:MAG: hypothetical protein Q7S99_03075 [Parvibaculum sp.]|nr:hypothetical protein [Parvibaculum sp.]
MTNYIADRFIPAGSVKVTDRHSDAVVYLYEARGQFMVVAYHGKAGKRDFHFRYTKEATRTARVAEFFKQRQARRASMAARKAESNKPHTLEVGHVLKSTWGYDQTNVDFYEVVEVNGAHMVTIRKIASSAESTGDMTAREMPVIGEYISAPKRKRVTCGGVRIASYSFASLWDCRPVSTSSYA